MNLKEAMRLLAVKPPKLTKKMTQEEVDKRVLEWKEEELPKLLKARQKETHPDKGGDAAIFGKLHEAMEVVKKKLQLKAYKPPPAEVDKCRSCKSARIPKDAVHCWDCGMKYELEAPRPRCPVCDVGRNPIQAKFCYNCGYDYQVPDALLERMRAMGFTEGDIQHLQAKGTVGKWRRRSAFDQGLRQDMQFELSRRKMSRGDNSGMADIFRGMGAHGGPFR